MPNKNMWRWIATTLFLGMTQSALASTPWSEATHQLAFGDFNGDGKSDVLYIARDHTLPSGIALSDGTAPTINHQSWPSNQWGIPWHSGTYKAFVADFNGDSRADIFLQRQSPGDHYLLLANSAGQFLGIAQTIANSTGGQAWSADAHRIVVGDFDGNGRWDLFLQAVHTNDSNAVFLSDANGNFGPAKQSWGNTYMGFKWSLQSAVVYAGKFNGDAKSDLLILAKPDIVVVDYDVPFPVPIYKPNTFGIVNAKADNASQEIFYAPALQIWSRFDLGVDMSAVNFNAVVGNFDGSNGDDIFLQSRGSAQPNRLLLAGSSGQLVNGDALPAGSSLASFDATQYRLHAARMGGGGATGIYAQALTETGTNQIAANVTSATPPIAHDPNLLNIVTPGTAVGAIPGEFSVDPTGAASYKIGIEVPPGVAGLAPELGLVYSSQGGNGLVGVGWQLAGLSAITRCPTTTAQDGVGNSGGVDFENDAFCLDGQRLMAIGTSTNGSIAAEYRTEVETQQKITSAGGVDGDPGWFSVRDKAGLIREYGGSSSTNEPDMGPGDSRFEARFSNGAGGSGLVWAVKVIKDRFDNFIEYRYDQDSNSNNFWPVEISYGSNPGGAKTVVGRVVFTYASRGDTRTGYITKGYVTSMTKRLQKVSVYGRKNPTVPGANDLVRQYYLDYEYSSTTKFSHLIGLTLCDGGQGAVQRCFKSSKFQWQYGYRGFTESSVATNVDFGSTIDLKMLDADGDGRSDYVYRHAAGQNTGQWLVRYASLVHSKGSGSYVATGIDRKQSSRAFAIDWNNDGYADLVDSTDTVSGPVTGYAGNYRVLMGGPTGFLSSNVSTFLNLAAEGLTFNGMATAVGDFDGDGRQDFAYSPSSNSDVPAFDDQLKVRLNNAANQASGLEAGSLISTTVSPFGSPPSSNWDLADVHVNVATYLSWQEFKDEPALYTINFDGDGRDDLLVRVSACYETETSPDHIVRSCQPEFHVYSVVNGVLTRVWAIRNGDKHLKIGDFNGDGLTDALMYGSGFDPIQGAPQSWRLDLGTGSKGLLGIPAFKNVMAASSIAAQSECSDADFEVFNVAGEPGYTGSNCTGSASVTLTEQMLDSAMPFDYNRDGYTDLILARSGYWQVLPGGPTGYVGSFINTGRQARKPKYATLVDDGGDGLPDILFPWDTNPENNWHVYYGRGPAVQGVIEKITDGFGAQTTIQYLPLTATTNTSTYVGTVYKGHTRFPEDPNSATEGGFRQETVLGWPNAHVAGPMPVVYQFTADNGLGAPGSASSAVRTTYEYRGLKMNRAGRGSLGFSQIRSWNDNSEIESRNRFAQQAFPFYGMLLTSEQRFRDLATFNASLANGYDPNSLLLNYSSACDADVNCAQLNPSLSPYDENAAYKTVSYTTNTLSEAPGNGGKTHFPYVRKSTNLTYPVSAGSVGDQPYKRIVTEYLQSASSTADAELTSGIPAYDAYSNPASVRITTTNGSTGGTAISRDEHVVLTTNTFTNDIGNWCLARLTNTSVVHTKPGTNSTGNSHAATTLTRTASFTYQSGYQCVLLTETTEPTANSGQMEMTKTYAYDAYGNRYKETASGYGIPSGSWRTTGSMLADGSSSFVATQGQFPTEVRNAAGHVEATSWEGQFGLATFVTGPNGLVAASQYDTFGRKIRETPITALSSAYSDQTFYWCANTGMCWDSRSVYALRNYASDGKESWTEHDRLGRAIVTRERGFDGSWIAGEKYFDPLGREYLASRPYKPAIHPTRCWSFKKFDVLGRATLDWSSYASSECTSTVPGFSDDPSSIGPGRQSAIVYDILPSPGVAGSQGANGIAQRIIGNASDTTGFATVRVSYKLTNVMDQTRFVQDELTTSGCPTNGSPISSNSTGCLQTEYDHDAQGNLTYTKQAGTLGTGTNATSRTLETKVWLNLRGFKTQMSDPDMGTWSYGYNTFGELTSQTDARGQITTLGYDKLGRLTSRVEKLAGGTTELSATWTYDSAPMGVGKLASTIGSDGYGEWYAYDALGRMSQVKRLLSGSYYYLNQSYDYLGRADVLKYPGSVAGDSSSGPEADGNRLRVRNNYNGYGFLESVQDVALGTTYWRGDAADENGSITQETLGNSRITKRYFDRSSGHLLSIKTGTNANETEVQNLELAFDQAANLRSRKDSSIDVNANAGIREEYGYDALYRLTQMRQYKPASLGTGSPSRVHNYSYDGFGNLLSKGTSYTSYCYNTQAAGGDPCAGVTNTLPHAAKRVVVDGTARDYTFNENGHVIGASTGLYDTVSWYVSNYAKRVSKGSKYTEFAYGPDRARYQQYLYRGSGDTETTVYFGNAYERLTKVAGGTTTVEHTHYVRAGDKVVVLAKRQQVNGGAVGVMYTRYLHRDHLGSIVAMTDAGGVLLERSGFDPWGKRTSYQSWDPVTPGTFTAGGTGTGGLTTGVTSTKRGFTGHEHVEELGFVHMNGRIYDSELGRFFSPDPTMQFPESTQGFNRYAYAGNNPLTNFDPSGFSFEKVLSAVGTVLGFVPGMFWASLIINAAVGFMQGGAEGGMISLASSFIPIKGGVWAQIWLAVLKGPVTNALISKVGGYQVSWAQAATGTAKALPSTIAMSFLNLVSAPDYAAEVSRDAACAGTDEASADVVRDPPESTQTGAKTEVSRSSGATRSFNGIEITFDANVAGMADALDLLATSTDLEYLREMKVTADLSGKNGIRNIHVQYANSALFRSGEGISNPMHAIKQLGRWFGPDRILIQVNAGLNWAEITTADIASILGHEIVHGAQMVQPSLQARTAREDRLYRYRMELQAYRYQQSIESVLGVSELLRKSVQISIINTEANIELCADNSSCHMER